MKWFFPIRSGIKKMVIISASVRLTSGLQDDLPFFFFFSIHDWNYVIQHAATWLCLTLLTALWSEPAASLWWSLHSLVCMYAPIFPLINNNSSPSLSPSPPCLYPWHPLSARSRGCAGVPGAPDVSASAVLTLSPDSRLRCRRSVFNLVTLF